MAANRASDRVTHAIEPAVPRPIVRLDSMDQLRGLVIVLMALDHIRDFFHTAAYQGDNPLDVQHTSLVLYATRWVTHLCAPTFVFLAGVGAYWRGHRTGGFPRTAKAELSWFLVTRGGWLIVLELTYISWLGWYMSFEPAHYNLQVLWALGASMIVLAALVWLPHGAICALGVAIVALHNATDGWTAAGAGRLAPLWELLHLRGPLDGFTHIHVRIGYPLLPWIGVMLLGYSFGPIAMAPAEVRQRWQLRLGTGALAAFAILRGANLYGDPTPWTPQGDWLRSLGAIMNVQKYPPALAYVLATLACSLLLWRWLDRHSSRLFGWLTVFGSVPMFVYLLHLPLIHGLAAALHQLVRGDGGWLVGARYMANGEGAIGARLAHAPGWPDAPGFSLAVVYGVWFGVIAILYPLASWFADVKRRHRNRWLSYL